ncbi:MAG TPA: hypothetical protein VG963_18185, partial [Polyangiaceae bacterium]|nr:hypothetical protein [Polyangiaceae bacterium]
MIERQTIPSREGSADEEAADPERSPLAYIDPRPLLGSFQSDLYFPRYRVVERGAWAIRAITMLCARGYWGEV